jgi:hypothetical protein
LKQLLINIVLAVSFCSYPILSQQTILKVSPSDMNINLFSEGEFVIKVENINAFRAYSIHLSYNSQKLRCLNISQSTFFSSWQTFFYKMIDSTSNLLKIDEAILGPGYTNGSGDLIRIQYQALAVGDVNLNFVITDLRDTSNIQIPLQIQNGLLHITDPTSAIAKSQDYLTTGLQSYPNPFNSSTRIEYTAKYDADTDFNIFSITGEEVYANKIFSDHNNNISFTWNGKNKFGSNMPSGIYLLVVKNLDDIQIIKLILLK